MLFAAAGWSQDAAPPELQTIVSRMEDAMRSNRQRYRPYVVTREYRLFGGQSEKPNSEVIAAVSFVPPGNKSYRIEKTSGSERGEKIVRRILNKETKMAGDYDSTAMTRANYDFKLLGQEQFNGRTCWVLALAPKRKEDDLIRGRAWVDAESYLIHLVEGKPGRNPSWWLKDVQLSLSFGEVRGMWLQHQTRAVAEVRLFGRHTLTSRSMSYQTAESVASQTAVPARKSARSYRSMKRGARVLMGTGILEQE